jgi:perosamine synthetase
MKKYIPVSRPCLDNAEKLNVVDALDKGAISGFYGDYLPRFEEAFAAYSGCKYGVATTSGTTALHLAMLTLSIGKGDEVLVSTLTNMATFFAVIYQGAKPIPIDIEEDTFNIDTTLLESKISSRTKAILVVHLFGHPVDMDPVMLLARKYNLCVIEDCAQAHGATYKGKKVGGIGDIGCFSFYANKIITTGEGGMVTTNNSDLADRARSLKSLAFGKSNKFMHTDVGYNYRMTNLQAAIGCAQLGKIENIISSKRKIAAFYANAFSSLDTLQLPLEKTYARHVYWMYHINLLGPAATKREYIMKKLQELGIETREGFVPYNMQEIFINRGWVNLEDCPKANRVALSSFYLPSGPLLTEEELEYVVIRLKLILCF